MLWLSSQSTVSGVSDSTGLFLVHMFGFFSVFFLRKNRGDIYCVMVFYVCCFSSFYLQEEQGNYLYMSWFELAEPLCEEMLTGMMFEGIIFCIRARKRYITRFTLRGYFWFVLFSVEMSQQGGCLDIGSCEVIETAVGLVKVFLTFPNTLELYFIIK